MTDATNGEALLPCPCSQGREQAMVTVKTDAAGSPAVFCDPCIADLVSALNAGGCKTAASCCGHGERQGIISLKDGRELILIGSYDEARAAEKAIEAARRQPTASAGMILPCDVFLPPATKIGKGCTLSTLVAALELRNTSEFVHMKQFTGGDVKALRALLAAHESPNADTTPDVSERGQEKTND